MNRQKIILVVVVIVVAAILAFLFGTSDLGLKLRTQTAFLIPTTVVKELRWAPPSDTTVGDYPITIEATDSQGATTTHTITIHVEAPGTPLIQNITVEPGEDQAIISWQTDISALPILHYDIFSNPTLQIEGAQVGLDHSITVTGLLPCTEYVFVVTARAADQVESNSNEEIFTTKGCTADATPISGAKARIAAGSGGSLALSNEITLTVPRGATATDAMYQIHQLPRDEALAAIGAPEGLSPVTGLFELKALSTVSVRVGQFQSPIQVDLSYTPGTDTDENSIVLYRYDGAAWQPLSGCTVDTSAKRVSCNASQFSAVAGFGTGGGSDDPTPTPTPTPQQGGGDGGDGGGGGGDGGGGGGGDEGSGEPAPQPRGKVYRYHGELGKIEGSVYSRVVPGGTRLVAKLADNISLLSQGVRVPRKDYWLDVKVRHDRPGPVIFAIYLNDRAWKVVRIGSPTQPDDDKYYLYRVGLLRNFSQATIRFRMLNDVYNKKAPTDEKADRNLFIDYWHLEERR